MIKVIVADDEEKVCKLICNLVDWAEFDMEIVGTAQNGFEALELIDQLRPDLLVTDIRMPGLTGLELISRARQMSGDLEFIIVSGYRQFDYAQQALKFGVKDYLLKPIKKAELTVTLEKVCVRYRQRTEQLSREEELRRHLRHDMQLLRAGLIRELLQDKMREALTLERLNREYHYAMRPGCFQTVGVKVDGVSELPEGSVLREKIMQLLGRSFHPVCFDMECVVQGAWIWSVLNYPVSNVGLVRKGIRAVLDELLVQRNLLPGEFTIGLGSVADSPQGLAQSMDSARKALENRLLQGTERILTPPETGIFPYGQELLAHFSTEMARGLEVLEPCQVRKTVDAMGRQLIRAEGVSGSQVLYLAGEACRTFLMLARGMMYELPEAEGFLERFQIEAEACSSAQQVWQTLTARIGAVMESYLEQKRQADTRPIRVAKQFILEHLGDPLALEDVSSAVGFNASYFSTLFKKETGESFVEYLSKMRMNRAKELLKETDLPVSEICRQVGYVDLKYFSKCFVKATGIKPAEFRKLYS